MNFGGSSLLVENGERDLIRLVAHLAGPAPLTVLDVGANVGDYATMALHLLEGAEVHCVEPSSVAASKLNSRFAAEPRVSIHQYALGDGAAASAPLWGEQPGSSQSSLYRRVLPETKLQIQERVAVRTLDDAFDEYGAARLSLLKIDAEGAEYAVLNGARRLLAQSLIDVIQFEFGGTQIDSGHYLRDFYHLLMPGYRLYRLLHDGLAPLPPYDERLEIFLFMNYVAIREDLAMRLPSRAFRTRQVVGTGAIRGL